MRSVASDESLPGWASCARLGPACREADADATSRSATASAAELAERRTAAGVEEVHARDVDGDRDPLGQAEERVCGESGDEVRTRGDDSLGARRRLGDLLVLPLADRERVDLEVDDRLAPERLDELDLRVHGRQIRPFGRRMEVLAPHPGDDRAAAS